MVHLLAEQGVRVAAITDHDSTEGLDEAFEAAKETGLRLIPGIEMSADHPDGSGDLHILGYFLDYHDLGFQQELKGFRQGRLERAQLMVEKLSRLGMPLQWERVKQIAGDASIGRPHIAQAMVEKGYIGNVKAAFSGYIEDGGPAFVGRSHISTEEAVKLIKRVGGVAVLAHPIFVPDYEEYLPRFAELGMVGMEVDYAEFGPDTRKHLGRLAKSYALLACGGSDYHAFGTKGELLPGSAGPSAEVLRELEHLTTG
jgi:predicted metal-dependent phosphoesterase TrpH